MEEELKIELYIETEATFTRRELEFFASMADAPFSVEDYEKAAKSGEWLFYNTPYGKAKVRAQFVDDKGRRT